MKFMLRMLEVTRKNALELTKDLTEAELLVIPPGFRNNLLWNMGHMLTSQQRLCYGQSDLPMHIPESLLPLFRKGTDPTHWKQLPDTGAVRKGLAETSTILRKDLEAGIFSDYQPYQTSFGVLLENIRDALAFSNVHENIHFGVMLSLKKIVRGASLADAGVSRGIGGKTLFSSFFPASCRDGN
jgi:hypothetical protein